MISNTKYLFLVIKDANFSQVTRAGSATHNNNDEDDNNKDNNNKIYYYY